MPLHFSTEYVVRFRCGGTITVDCPSSGRATWWDMKLKQAAAQPLRPLAQESFLEEFAEDKFILPQEVAIRLARAGWDVEMDGSGHNLVCARRTKGGDQFLTLTEKWRGGATSRFWSWWQTGVGIPL